MELLPGHSYEVLVDRRSGAQDYQVLVHPGSDAEEIVIKAGQVVVRVQDPGKPGLAHKATIRFLKTSHDALASGLIEVLGIELVSERTDRASSLVRRSPAPVSERRPRKVAPAPSSVHQLTLF